MISNPIINLFSGYNSLPKQLENLLTSSVCFFYKNYKNHNEILSKKFQVEFSVSNTAKFKDLIYLFDENDFASLEQSILNPGDTTDFTQTIKTIDGKKSYFCFGKQSFNQDGKEEAILVIFTDATAELHNKFENLGLKDQTKKFSEIINSIEFPVWQRNEDLKISFFNICYSDMIAECIDNPDECFENELSEEARQLAQEAFDKQNKTSKHLHLIINNSRLLYNFTEIPTEKGTIGFAYNIAEQERLEQNLQSHKSAQSDILESLTSAMAVFEADTRIKFYNSAFVDLWNLDERWLDTSPTFSEILDVLREKRELPEQADFKEFKKERVKFFKDLIKTHNEFFYLPDNRTLRVVYIPYAIGGLVISFEDITDRLALERSFNTLAAVQKTTLDNLQEAVAVFGEHGKIKLFNPMYAKIWQLSPELLEKQIHISEILEKTKHLYKNQNRWENFKEKITSYIVGRETKVEKIYRTDNKVLNWECVPLPDGGTLMTYEDITDSDNIERTLRERYKALEHIDNLKTKFLENVSYELRSPLTNIKGFAEMLLTPKYAGELGETQKTYIKNIYDSSLVLAGMIDDMLQISLLEAGYTKLNTEEISLYSFIHEVFEENFETTKTKEINFQVQCSKNIGTLWADKKLLKQALKHLVDNAIRFTNKEGNITLGAKQEKREKHEKDESIILYVKNSGIGIKKEEKLAVLQKFYKLPSEKFPGSREHGIGLSLSITKSLIELHGGKVNLISEQPGSGTTVYLELKRKSLKNAK